MIFMVNGPTQLNPLSCARQKRWICSGFCLDGALHGKSGSNIHESSNANRIDCVTANELLHASSRAHVAEGDKKIRIAPAS